MVFCACGSIYSCGISKHFQNISVTSIVLLLQKNQALVCLPAWNAFKVKKWGN